MSEDIRRLSLAVDRLTGQDTLDDAPGVPLGRGLRARRDRRGQSAPTRRAATRRSSCSPPTPRACRRSSTPTCCCASRQLPKVDKEWRRELLDKAYMRAYGAPEQYRRATTQQVPPDSRQGAQLFAYATALTRVTLQIRAVELMAFVDPEHARELFEWIDLNLARRAPAPIRWCRRSTSTTRARTRSRGSRFAATLRRAELLRAVSLARASAVRDAGGRARDSALPARRRRGGTISKGCFGRSCRAARATPPGFSSAALDIIARMADLQIADTEHRRHRLERDGRAARRTCSPSSRRRAAPTT